MTEKNSSYPDATVEQVKPWWLMFCGKEWGWCSSDNGCRFVGQAHVDDRCPHFHATHPRSGEPPQYSCAEEEIE